MLQNESLNIDMATDALRNMLNCQLFSFSFEISIIEVCGVNHVLAIIQDGLLLDYWNQVHGVRIGSMASFRMSWDTWSQTGKQSSSSSSVQGMFVQVLSKKNVLQDISGWPCNFLDSPASPLGPGSDSSLPNRNLGVCMSSSCHVFRHRILKTTDDPACANSGSDQPSICPGKGQQHQPTGVDQQCIESQCHACHSQPLGTQTSWGQVIMNLTFKDAWTQRYMHECHVAE